MTEEWRDIPGYDGVYQASNLGGIRSVDRLIDQGGYQRLSAGRVLKQTRRESKHLQVSLYSPNHKCRTIKVHQLVMWAFVGPAPDGLEVCHNNGRHEDNRLENLRYDTHEANMADMIQATGRLGAYEVGRDTCTRGHEYTPSNTGWTNRSNGRRNRYCRLCSRDRAAQRRRSVAA